MKQHSQEYTVAWPEKGNGLDSRGLDHRGSEENRIRGCHKTGLRNSRLKERVEARQEGAGLGD